MSVYLELLSKKKKRVEREKLQENIENAIKKLNLKDTKLQLE